MRAALAAFAWPRVCGGGRWWRLKESYDEVGYFRVELALAIVRVNYYPNKVSHQHFTNKHRIFREGKWMEYVEA